MAAVAAVAVVLDLILNRNESGTSQDGGGNEHSRSSPPNYPPRPQYQATYQATYGTNSNPGPARQPLAPRNSYVPPSSALTTTDQRSWHVAIAPPPPRPQPVVLPPSSAALRERAAEAGNLMAQAFSQSKILRSSGFLAEAQRLSEDGQGYKRTMETLNEAASKMIFKENNRDREPNEVDLHGLFVKEAELKVNEAISAAEARGDPSVRFIVGQGLHSDDGVAKLKPALTTYIRKLRRSVDTDRRNAGVLVVSFRHGADDEVPKGHRKQRRPRKERASPRVSERQRNGFGAVPAARSEFVF